MECIDGYVAWRKRKFYFCQAMSTRDLPSSFMLAFAVFVAVGCARAPSAFESAVDDLKGNRFDRALPVLEAESLAGNRDAQLLLAKVYAAGIGVEKNIEKAGVLFMCRARDLCVPGKDEYFLAIDFLDGAGVDRSREDAIYWLKLSGARGYLPAAEKLKDMELGYN